MKIPKPFMISEIFGPTIQGEGALIGCLSLFIRFGGCDYRCQWCDTLYAVLPEHKPEWESLTTDTIMERVRSLAPPPLWVTLSGGNPAMYDLTELVHALKTEGYQVACETQGSLAKEWFHALDMLILSPKPPSAGNVTHSDSLQACLEFAPLNTVLKIVCFDRDDYVYARNLFRFYAHLPAVIQIGTPTDLSDETDLIAHYRQMTTQLLEWMKADHLHHARLLPQLHRLLFEANRGV